MLATPVGVGADMVTRFGGFSPGSTDTPFEICERHEMSKMM